MQHSELENDDIPEWMKAENERATAQAGQHANSSFKEQKAASPQVRKKAEPPKKEVKQVQRVNKGFQVEMGRAQKWDRLVASMKSSLTNKKTGPELIDEAIDYLCSKYKKDLEA